MDDDFEDAYGSAPEDDGVDGEIDDLEIVAKAFPDDPDGPADQAELNRENAEDVEDELNAEDDEIGALHEPMEAPVVIDTRGSENIPATLLTGDARVLNPRMTRNEFAKIRAVRCEQIEKGDAVFVDCGSCEPSDICEAEINAGKCPLSILRPIKAPTVTTGGVWELWSANELQWGEAVGR